MDIAVILTYRCNSKCSMCHVWQNPTLPDEEVSLATLAKIPDGIDYLNLTGGEPTLRKDLGEVVDLLYPKAMQLEISSNGLHSERLEPIIKKHPRIKIRFSLEGFEATNNAIRGEKDGFQRKVAGLRRLKEMGGSDLGFAITIQDDNAYELVELFRFAHSQGLELATSTLHNGFQFHKNDNMPHDRQQVAKQIEGLITEQLRTSSVKNWFRAYLNLGLVNKVLGYPRLLRCSAASDFVFIDPWGDAFACNVRPDLKLGSLEKQSWDELLSGARAQQIRQQVYDCKHNCWMVGSAKTAMRNRRFAKIPKMRPLLWVLENKLRVQMGMRVPFEKYVGHSSACPDQPSSRRVSYLDRTAPKQVQRKEHVHYAHLGEFLNR